MTLPSASVRTLIVEDDPDNLRFTAFQLRHEGHDVITATTGAEAIEVARRTRPDVIILDIGLPDMGGIEVCRRLRAQTSAAIIFLTDRREEVDKVLALDAGGDDYVVKPVSGAELAARIRAIVRRSRGPAGPSVERLESHEIILDGAARRVFVRGQEVALTPTEFELLRSLLTQPGRAIGRHQLLDAIWGIGFIGNESILDTYIRRLRRKIERDPGRPELIQTVRGVGYRFAER